MIQKIVALLLLIILTLIGLLVSFLVEQRSNTCYNDECYCEPIQNGTIILQPISFYSCLAFPILALLIIIAAPSYTPYWYLWLYVIYITNIGSFSMIFHSEQTFFGEYLDGVSISMYVWFLFSLNQTWFKTMLVFGSLFIIGLQFVESATKPLFGILVGIVLLKLLWIQQKNICYPITTMIIAGLFWLLTIDDVANCPMIFGHGVWHIFTALTAFILFFIQIPIEEPSKLQVTNDDLLLTGSSQYKQIWTRDTCMSLIALYYSNKKIQDKDAYVFTRNFLKIFSENRIDYKGPLVIERGFCCPSARFLGWTIPIQIGPDEWNGWNYHSSDADVLAALVLKLYYPNEKNLVLFNKDKHVFRDGLLTQEPFSDFQDSRDKSPVTFLLNLFYWKYLDESSDPDAESFKNKLQTTFYKDGMYVTMPYIPSNYYCLEDNLFAILLGFNTTETFKTNVKNHWLDKKKSSLSNQVYKSKYVPLHWIPYCVGLRHYHDRIEWPWLNYFYAGIFNTKPTITEEFKYKEIVWDDHLLYYPERDFLLSYCFWEFYKNKNKDTQQQA